MFRGKYIMEMVTKHKKDSIVSIPLMLNYKDIASDEIPALYSVTEVDDTTIITNVIFRLNVTKPKGEKEYTDMEMLAEEHVYTKDKNGDNVGEPSVHRYSLLTKHELHLIDLLEDFNDRRLPGDALPKELRDVKEEKEYSMPISRVYSNMLEEYLSNSFDYEITSFYDLLFPVVERNSATLLKASVFMYITSNPDNWSILIENNSKMIAPVSQQYSKIEIKKTVAAKDVKDAFNNYMNCVYNVFSILSAVKRGKDLSTSDILRSCPEKTTREALLDKATDTLRISPFSNELPLFSNEFITDYLMGKVPMFLIGDSSEEGDYFGCDIFKQLKEKIIYNTAILLSDVKIKLQKSAMPEMAEVLNTLESGTSQIKMTGMYSSYLKTPSKPENGLSMLLDGKYECVFVDFVVYAAALQVYCGKALTEFSIFDFINLVSPIQVNKEV